LGLLTAIAWAAGCSPGISGSDCCYLAGRNATWTMKAAPGAGCNE
jgi:hypothetical protein